MPDRRRAVVAVYVRTGARFESPKESGLSHFLEHMLFRGTKEHPSAHLLSTAFEDLGGTLEASTAADHGTVEIDVPHENLGEVIPLMADLLSAPLLGDLELERSIIREELLGDLDDKGEMIDPASLLRQLAFPNNGLGQAITGPLSNIESFTEEQIREHHERSYIGRNLIVSIAGPLCVEQISESLRRSFSTMKKGDALEFISPGPQRTPRFIAVAHPGSSQSSLSLGFRCPGYSNPQEAAIEMLLRIIDDGMATRLYHRLCDSSGLCYSANGGYEAYEEVGLVEFEADAAHERCPDVLKELLNLSSELGESLISDAEFERCRRRARWQYEAYFDDIALSADFFALAALSQTAPEPMARLNELLDVSKKDILDVASKVFAPENRNVVCVGDPSRSQTRRLREMALS